jgi:hypothetical protein
MKGGTGLRLRSFVVTSRTTNLSPSASATISFACASLPIRISFFLISCSKPEVLTVCSPIL